MKNLIKITCQVCKTEFQIFPSESKIRKCCSNKCRTIAKTWIKGKKSPLWKGGRYVDPTDGYIRRQISGFEGEALKIAKKMAYSRKKNVVLEHRIIMAIHLGRPLKSNEIVHHKNGIRDDNRIENLELFSKPHHKGSKIICPYCHLQFTI